MTCAKCPFSLPCHMRRLMELYLCQCGRLSVWNKADNMYYNFRCEKRRFPSGATSLVKGHRKYYHFHQLTVPDFQRPPYGTLFVEATCVHCWPPQHREGENARRFAKEHNIDLEPESL